MVRSGRSLTAGWFHFEDAGMSNMARAANLVLARTERGESVADAIAGLSPTYETPIRLAIETTEKTGSVDPVIETIAMIRRRNRHRRRVRFALLGPMLNVIVAVTLTMFVVPWLLTAISKTEPIAMANAPLLLEACRRLTNHFLLSGAIALILIGVMVGVLYFYLGKAKNRVDRFADHSMFSRWLAMMVESKQDVAQAVDCSAAAVGESFLASWQTAAQNIRTGANASHSIAMPSGTPDLLQRCVVDLVAGSRHGDAIATDLRQLATLYDQQSETRFALTLVKIPRLVGNLIVIAIIVFLLRITMIPLLDMIEQSI